MKQTFTLNQCVRMLYGETTPEETFMLQEIIDSNENLGRQVREMRQGFEALSFDETSPKPSVVNSILRYSRNNALEFSA